MAKTKIKTFFYGLMSDTLILPKIHPGRILKNNKKVAKKLNYDGIKFSVEEKIFNKVEIKNNICINVFGYENGFLFPIYVSDQMC